MFSCPEGDESVTLKKMTGVEIVRHVPVKGGLNPFDPAWETYLEERAVKMAKANLWGKVFKLWERQKGLCPACGTGIGPEDGNWHVHHVMPKHLGGKDTLLNLMLVHTNCHRKIHAKR